MAGMRTIKRSDIASFINVKPDTTGEGTYDWKIFGNGVTSANYSYNPQTTTETWIVNDNATTILDSYQFAIDGEQNCLFGDPVFDFVDSLRHKLAVGGDAETQVLLVEKYSVTEDTKFRAQVFNVTIAVNEFGGDGGATPKITYTISANGNPKQGTVTILDGVPTFEEADAAA